MKGARLHGGPDSDIIPGTIRVMDPLHAAAREAKRSEVSANANQLRVERFTEIGMILQRDAALLVEMWSQQAIVEQPRAHQVHHQALLDHLRIFLRELGATLADTQIPDSCPYSRPAREHGQQRWEVGWSLPEVVRDYQLLRLVVLEHLEKQLPRPLLLSEVQAVGLALDEAIESSVVEYVKCRDVEMLQLQRSLQEADRRKNEFLATLAHELRNPLAPLRNALAVVRLEKDSAAGFQAVRELMERQVEQMSRLVEDLLDVTRIAQDKLTLRREQLDLRQAIEQAVQMNSPLGRARQHQVQVVLPAEPLWVEGDPVRLVQIIVNLLNNATKYTPERGRIEVSASAEGGEVVVRVKDNGIGIPAAQLSQIFDLFAQLDLGTERAQGGLGIGLALVRRLVDLHGGTITAFSNGPGTGSEFVVRLPRQLEPAADPGKEKPPTPASPSRHILIVEDNSDGRESLAILLRLLGHRVEEAENGQRGLELALAARPEAILLDIGLPDRNGYEVGRELRQGLGPAVLLVALTGHGQPEDRLRAAEAGFNAHLVKPVEPDALQHLLLQDPPPTLK